MLLGDILRKNAKSEMYGNKVALIFRGESWTYQELNRQVNRLSRVLLQSGVQKGDRVAVLGRNSARYVMIYFALAKIGAIMVPVNFWYKGSEIQYTLTQSGSSVFIVHRNFSETVLPILPDLQSVRQVFYYQDPETQKSDGNPPMGPYLEELMELQSDEEPLVKVNENDPHIILYTSGTTGFPKGAVLSHKNHYLHALAWALKTGNVEEDRGLVLYPLFHTGGPDCILLPHFMVGATVIILDRPDPEDILEMVQKYRVTNIFCVPTVWRRLLAVPNLQNYDLSSVKRCLGSSDTFPPDLLNGILQHFHADVYVTYGLTEAGCILTFCRLTRQNQAKINSVGKPHPLVEVRIVNKEGKDVAVGEVGEIIARGPTIMQGYWNMPEKTAETLREGWLYSGDLGRYDEEGFIYIVGRSKDMIISGGEKIYPVEIEKLLRQHDKIKDVAVIGIPDREWGESVLAVVVPQEGAMLTKEEVIDYVRTRLAGYKKPKYVEFVETLPVTTATGKVQKAVLRERYKYLAEKG
ncbi:MAG TPA: long-chain-fatty-acid--CoA ligase [Candidatus Limnocylindrales bacterium]|nr:long-chain-fatty-acid--CoA ligase [Candidatus Limnocylindrales bacterium]